MNILPSRLKASGIPWVICVISLSVSGCLVQEIEDSGSANQKSCSFTQKETYYVDEDLSTDFTASDVSVEVLVTKSTCAGLEAGSTEYAVIDEISRADDTLTFTVEGTSAEIAISGTSVIVDPLATCSEGVSVFSDLDRGKLLLDDDRIELTFTWKLVEDGCQSAFNTVLSRTDTIGGPTPNGGSPRTLARGPTGLLGLFR